MGLEVIAETPVRESIRIDPLILKMVGQTRERNSKMSRQANILSLAYRYLWNNREVVSVVQKETRIYFIDADPEFNAAPLVWSVSPNGHIEERESVNGEWVLRSSVSYHLMGFSNQIPAALPPIRG